MLGLNAIFYQMYTNKCLVGWQPLRKRKLTWQPLRKRSHVIEENMDDNAEYVENGQPPRFTLRLKDNGSLRNESMLSNL
jgi:hypothetical protein